MGSTNMRVRDRSLSHDSPTGRRCHCNRHLIMSRWDEFGNKTKTKVEVCSACGHESRYCRCTTLPPLRSDILGKAKAELEDFADAIVL
jgi:hypothetical protein